MSEVAFEHSQFDRFFYKHLGKEVRVKPLMIDMRRGFITVEILGGDCDGERIRCEREDLRIHWDCPKDHPDW